MTALAAVRPPSEALTRGATLTHLPRAKVDPDLLLLQHAGYCAALEEGGVRVVSLPVLPDLPDATFVEDLGVAVPGIFIWGRSTAPARREERRRTLAALGARGWDGLAAGLPGAGWVSHRIEAPGSLDGGDVLLAGRTVLVGRSGRTNAAGIRQVAAILEPLGYRVRSVAVSGALHLKTACTALDDETLLVNPGWVRGEELGGFRLVAVDSAEPFGANVLPVRGGLLVPSSAPRTRERVEDLGYATTAVDVSEFEKAEGGLTCLSLRLP
ncbi:MAG TPA: arginine deiminase family protein [Longimicrobiales bacterium]|nr:arginine deiminase family protein [Longimicrobiales bacterium]